MIILNKILFLFIIIGIIIYLINKIYIKKKNNNILIELLPTLIFIFIFRSFIYEPFKIPSASMMPTLLIGDLILVNKLLYNIKNPFNNKTLINIGKPNYGDVIVFQYPKNKKINYIKRVIGLPEDKLIYNEKTKKIKIYKSNNNKKKIFIKYSKKKISPYIEEIDFSNNNIKEYFWDINNKKTFKKNSEIFFLNEKTEYIENVKHNILLMNKKNINKNNIKTWIIPKDMYFVMGDYRDNSEDSRYWGFVHKNLIIGKAQYIWMSLEYQVNNLPIKIRFKRIGKIF